MPTKPPLTLAPYLLSAPKTVKLSKFDPNDTGTFTPDKEGKKAARDLLKKQKKRLAELQTMLYADSNRALLVVFQALDAGGKDGAIRKVFTGINPQGVQVTSFKVPSEEERAHDFLWRIHKAVPRKGMIGVFNRSHYEEVLVVRVKKLVPEKVWRQRFEQMNQFESLLESSGVSILKVYLHIDREAQKKRFEDRLHDPAKHWKFNPSDLSDRALWGDYMKAFEDVFSKCSSPAAPWLIVPANYKWYRDVIVAQAMLEKLEAMKLSYPKIDYDPNEVVIPD